MTLPKLTLGSRYVPLVCAFPRCTLPPHISWRVTRPGVMLAREWNVGDEVHLCGKHESKVKTQSTGARVLSA